MNFFPFRFSHLSLFLIFTLTACIDPAQKIDISGNLVPPSQEDEGDDPPAIVVGERLFRETRFAQFFKIHSDNNMNKTLTEGDPALETTETLSIPLTGPYRGKSMNCAACHLVDEQLGVLEGGIRAYADFARRSPIPDRGDGKNFTPRNSPSLVNSTLVGSGGLFLHFDGEFITTEDLVSGTLTGRNFGWLAPEKNEAVAHIASVIRQDDGIGDLAQNYGSLPYSTLLKGEDVSIPNEYQLPKAFRIDVEQATDNEIVTAISKIIGAYVNDLLFSQNNRGEFNGSPYDNSPRYIIR